MRFHHKRWALIILLMMMLMTEVGFDYVDYGDVAHLDAGVDD